MSTLIKFAKEREIPEDTSSKSWKVLIVDDDESVHIITRRVIEDIRISGRKLQVFSANSGAEAKTILQAQPDIALALVDVIMETLTAGLDLINYIRHELNNNMIRLIIRTGQPHDAPEKDVIDHYDINDYKEKTELTAQKLYTLLRSSIKQYEQLLKLEDKYQTTYQKMTTHPLTGLMNREKLTECLDKEGIKSLILINIDSFSLINETQSFEAGDTLLKQLAAFLQENFADFMQVFHLEGDLFALLYDESSPIETEKQVNRIKNHISSNNFQIQNVDTTITVTIGIAMHEEGNLIQKAELALKEARLYGHNHFQIYSSNLNIIKTIQSNSIWIKRVRDALLEDRVLAHFQPIINLATQHIEKYEILVRVRYDNEIFTPADFLDAAFYSGQTFPIFKKMFIAACKKCAISDFGYSVNLALDDLKQPGLLAFVNSSIEKYRLPRGRITLELLEYQSLGHNMEIKQSLIDLHQAGLLIAIDDFGAHCSNFSQLTDLPIDVIKIDGSFIENLPHDNHSMVVTKTITGFAHELNIPVVAEYVHSQEVLEAAQQMGIDYAQGFYLGEPQADLPGAE